MFHVHEGQRSIGVSNVIDCSPLTRTCLLYQLAGLTNVISICAQTKQYDQLSSRWQSAEETGRATACNFLPEWRRDELIEHSAARAFPFRSLMVKALNSATDQRSEMEPTGAIRDKLVNGALEGVWVLFRDQSDVGQNLSDVQPASFVCNEIMEG